jgi:hypothetical protein
MKNFSDADPLAFMGMTIKQAGRVVSLCWLRQVSLPSAGLLTLEEKNTESQKRLNQFQQLK